VPVIKLTARNVATLPPREGQRTDYRDGVLPGFFLRVSATGHRSFGLVYTNSEGRLKRLTIGACPPLGLADARDIARERLAEITKGADPQTAKVEARRRTGTDTLAALSARFLEEGSSWLRATTLKGWERYLRVEILPVLGLLPPEKISRAQVRSLVEAIARRGSPISANRTFEVIRRVFSWAIEKDLLQVSPCTGLKVTVEEKPRDRVYTNDDLRAILSAVPGTELEDLVPLLLATASRSEETRSARWSEMDIEENLWTIPRSKTKSDEPHPVPLSFAALAILRRIHAKQSGAPCPWVFPAPTREGFMDKPNKHVVLVRTRSGVADFRLHDLRRTVRTRIAQLGVAPHVAERVLGHVPAGIERTYNVHDFVPEMRAALNAWAEELRRIVAGEKKATRVIAFSRV
jgi:integrase